MFNRRSVSRPVAPVPVATIPITSAPVQQQAPQTNVIVPSTPVIPPITNSWSIGDLKMTTKTQDDGPWLVCDGRILDGNVFPELFSVIGTTYGGDTLERLFGLPDLRGKSALAADFRDPRKLPGTETGSEQISLTLAELPQHSHSVHIAPAGGHEHFYQDAYFGSKGKVMNQEIGGTGLAYAPSMENSFRFRTKQGTDSEDPSDLQTSSVKDHTHSVVVETSGQGKPFSVMGPSVYIGSVMIYAGRTM